MNFEPLLNLEPFFNFELKNMNRILSFSLALLISSCAFGQINFNTGSFEEIKAMAKEENHLIFVDIYTTWCGPCKWLSANHFQDGEVGEFFNANFIAFKIDAEKGDGIGFAETYQVSAYPTLLFINGDGELVHKGVGAPKDNQALIDLGQNALDPESQLLTLQKRYEMGEEDPMILMNYGKALAGAYEDANGIAEKYFSMMPYEQIFDPESWTFLTMTITNLESDFFQRILKDKDRLKEAHGEAVEPYFDMVFQQTIYKIAQEKDLEKLEKIKPMFQEMFHEEAKEKIDFANFVFYSSDEGQRHHYTKIYLDNYDTGWETLNQTAWTYYEKVIDTEELKDALAWVRKSIAEEKNYYNTDTEAHLLYKLKYWKDAKISAKQAIAVGRAAGENVAATENLMRKIKAKK